MKILVNEEWDNNFIKITKESSSMFEAARKLNLSKHGKNF